MAVGQEAQVERSDRGRHVRRGVLDDAVHGACAAALGDHVEGAREQVRVDPDGVGDDRLAQDAMHLDAGDAVAGVAIGLVGMPQQHLQHALVLQHRGRRLQHPGDEIEVGFVDQRQCQRAGLGAEQAAFAERVLGHA